MAGRWTKDFNFITAAACKGQLLVAMTSEQASREMQDLTIVAIWQDGTWRMHDDAFLWSVVDSVSIANPASTVFLGMWGQVLYNDGQTSFEENIYPGQENGPLHRGPMCSLNVIDGTIYSAGMGRQVYRRDQKGIWHSIDFDLRPEDDDGSIVGFNSIDGFSAQEVYAAGLNGEIWWLNSGTWVEIESPTNLPLNRIFCDDNKVYICGRNGILLAGQRNHWSVLEEVDIDDDLWSIARFQDELYILGTHGLYLLKDDFLYEVPIAGESIGFCQKLIADEDRMWLIGPKDLLYYDGNNWTRVD